MKFNGDKFSIKKEENKLEIIVYPRFEGSPFGNWILMSKLMEKMREFE